MTEKQLQDLREQLRQKMQNAGMMRPLPKDRRADRLERSATDKAFFLETYCPHYFPYAFTEHHRRILQRCDTLNQPYLIMAFRGFGKSAVASFGDPLYKICLQRRNFLLFVSITEDVAESFTTALKLEFEENPRLRQDFGELVGARTWTTTEGVTRSNRKFLARGIMQPFRGLRHGQYRPDDATLDDFENDQSADSPEQTSKILSRVWKAVRPAMQRQKDGGFSLKLIGTPITPDCATSRLYADDERDLLKDRVPLVDDNGAITWPEVYDQAEIDAIRKDSGLIAWHSEYILNPLPSDTAMFRPEWIQYVDTLPAFAAQDVTVGAIDTSGTVTGDFKAALTLTGQRVTGNFYVRHAFIRRCSPKELWRAVFEQQKGYDCWHIIEDNALKDYLWESRELFEKEHGVRLRLIPVTHSLAKKEHVLPLQSPLERKKMFFQKGQSDQGRLIEQLLAFPNGKNDEGPDVLGEAYRQAQNRMFSGGALAKLQIGRRRASAGLQIAYTDFDGWV